jgi:CheY-like chemotaxis protein
MTRKKKRMIVSKPIFIIADDDPDDQFLLSEMIEALDISIELHFVENGIELLDVLNTSTGSPARPDLVILDLNMPQMDGRQALRKIKTDPHLAGIPVAVLTTSNVDEDLQYCQQFGVQRYYHKPSSFAELRAIITDLYSSFVR